MQSIRIALGFGLFLLIAGSSAALPRGRAGVLAHGSAEGPVVDLAGGRRTDAGRRSELRSRMVWTRSPQLRLTWRPSKRFNWAASAPMLMCSAPAGASSGVILPLAVTQ